MSICLNGLLLAAIVSACGAELEVINEWNLLKFDVPFNYPRRPDYSPDRQVFTGIEVGWERLFIATPRLFPGVPTTLSWIPRNKAGYKGETSPPLQAYPSWDWHVAAASNKLDGNCTGMVSVFRIRADRCNRLWVLDSGVLDSLDSFNVVCPPKLLVFDMRTDQLLRSVTLPQEVLRRTSLLTNLVLDDQGVDIRGGRASCDNMFVYMSDTVSPGLVVYDVKKDTTWRLQHPYMFPSPDWGTYTVQGESFTLMDGIIGLAVTPAGSHPRNLYFQPFASDRIFSVPTSALQAGPNPGDDADLPVTIVGTKSSQAAGLAIDPKDGALHFSPVSETAIAAWIPGSPDHRVVAYSPELLQFATDLRAADRDSGNIWLISTRLQKFARRTVNPNEVNLRIMKVTPQLNNFITNNNSLYYFKKK